MFNYYVYAYLKKNGSPYYIGKGKGRRAYNKHEWVSVPKDKSKIVFLEKGLSNVGALALERRYIEWYGRKDIGTGILINKTDGGEDPPSWLGKNHTEETKKKISDSNKGRKFSETHKRNISESKKGNNYWLGKTHTEETKKKLSDSRKGKTHTEETKKKLSDSRKGKKLSENHLIKLSKRTLCITTKEIYTSVAEASRNTGIDPGNIAKCCRGKAKTAGKHPITDEPLRWAYA